MIFGIGGDADGSLLGVINLLHTSTNKAVLLHMTCLQL